MSADTHRKRDGITLLQRRTNKTVHPTVTPVAEEPGGPLAPEESVAGEGDSAPQSSNAVAPNDELVGGHPQPTSSSDPPESGVTGDDDPPQLPIHRGRRFTPLAVLAWVVLPAFALLLTGAAGYLKWETGTAHEIADARSQSVKSAVDTTIAMLSYRPDTVDKVLPAAASRLTGTFRGSYTELLTDVVIPGAQQKNISAAATVPAAASVSATVNHAVVLVFVNQTTTIGNDPPTLTTSSVRVTLERSGGQWLISDFTPI